MSDAQEAESNEHSKRNTAGGWRVTGDKISRHLEICDVTEKKKVDTLQVAQAG